MTDRRQVGGSSNKRGNRYEDHYAVYTLLKVAGREPHAGPGQVRLKEQTGALVDDFLLVIRNHHLYSQLKAGATVSWTARRGKLRREFEQQVAACTIRQEDFALALVVSEATLQKELQRQLPAVLAPHTRVKHFPYQNKLADLRLSYPRLDQLLAPLVATRFHSPTEFEHLLLAFQSAWLNHQPDSDGFCDLALTLDVIRRNRGARLKRDASPPPDWPVAQQILRTISDLEVWTDRGFLEFRFGSTDAGLYPEPLDSDSFARFVRRVVENPPRRFEDLEELWP